MEQNRILDIWLSSEQTYKSGLEEARQSGHKFWPKQSVFIKSMEFYGYTLVGTGMFSSVWRKGTKFYKINSNISGVFDGFYAWAKACSDIHDNPALPVFGDMIQIDQRYCIEIEPLKTQHLINGPQSLYSAAMTSYHMQDAIVLAINTCLGGRENRYARNYHSFDEIIPDLIETFLDVHSANLMKRGSQLVLNDPIASLDIQIPALKVA